MKRCMQTFAIGWLLVAVAFGQGSRKDDIAFKANGVAPLLIPTASIRVCTSGSAGTPCSPLASLFQDATLTSSASNPFTADAQGNYHFYAAPGRYDVQITDPGNGTVFTNKDVVLAPDVKNIPDLITSSTPVVDVRAFGGYPSGTLDQWTNAAIASIAPRYGKVKIPCGVYSVPAQINADLTSGLSIEGNGGLTAGAAACVEIIYTGITGPPISARSSFGFHLSNIQILWNNAAFTGDVVNTSHTGTACGGGGCDTSGLEIDHVYFAATGSGAAATNVLNLKDTISSDIHHNAFNSAAVAILGANVAGDYANAIHVHDNHFSSSTGTISAAMIRNLTSGSEINSNTFEMGAGAGSPIVFDNNIVNNPAGVDFHGNWVGDLGSAYNGTLFNIRGNGSGSGVAGMSIRANVVGGNQSATVTAFNFISGTEGVAVKGNYLGGGYTTLASFGGSIAGISFKNNFISSPPTIGTALAFSGSSNLNIVFEDNGWNGSPTTFMTGTPTTGRIQAVSGSFTTYGNSSYNSFTSDSNFNYTPASGNTFIVNGGGLDVNNRSKVTGNSNLPAATGTSLFMASGFGSPVLGAVYCGDGSGWQFEFRKRTASADTTLGICKDSGLFQFNQLQIGSSGSTINADYKGSGTLTYTAITAATCQEQPLTITGAAAGDACWASTGASDIGINFAYSGCRISATNTAQVKVCSASTATPSAVTWTGWARH